MKKVAIVKKREGETPFEALEVFRAKNKIPKKVPITYAGRLDPMAEGVLVLLIGEEVKNKEKYLLLDKEYEFSVLFGFATDTYDILGKVISEKFYEEIPKGIFEKDIEKSLKNFRGKIKQKYPMYSSKTVEGRPLFSYARGGEEVERPEREVHVKNLKLLKIRKINNKKLLENIEVRIKKVKGNFRQKEILEIWKKGLTKKNNFYVADFKIKCSSGTYVRSIANSLGEEIKISALAYKIKRTRVGKYML